MRDEAQDHVDRVGAKPRERIRRPEIATEYLREGRAIRHVEEAERADLPVQFDGIDAVAKHAIGDAAVAMAVDAFAQALERQPRPGCRHRIEHVEVLRPGLAERMARLGVLASVQPGFTYWEVGDISRLPDPLSRWAHPWRALAAAGCMLAFGSDNPVLPDFHPLQGVYAAVTRRNYLGQTFASHQGIGVAEALAAYTAGGAYAGFAEQVQGTLAPGKLADQVVLSANPLAVEPQALLEIQVERTFVAGREVFAR